MDDIKNKSIDQQDQDNYQEILDKYAASVKPETDITPPSSPETVSSETITTTTASASNETDPIINDNLTPPPETEVTPVAPVTPPSLSPEPESKTKTPEEIKAEIDRILVDDPNQTSSSKSEPITSPSVSSSSKFLKTLFIISLIIFLTIIGLLVYFAFFNKPIKNNSPDEGIVPTSVPEVTCELNGVEYKLGESFPSADGCNTCVCQSPDVITCTEMACDTNSTPEVEITTVTPAPSATKSGIKTITPTTSTSPTLGP
ncbi:MAG TPA: hypothetical protein PKZ92_01275 [Candidatus Woesebacteria bacterium]|jgi:hypothetical protein|nr:hypothetical protein [Candidatus Shapirobacteria bacterium]HOR01874.1 hypothetical protein [Candidatus Woesebacteria bacterium]